jgi:mono/diheme cytochrome c family protein
MKLWRRQSLVGVVFAVLVLGLILAACAPNADAQLVSPKLGTQLFAEEAGQEIKAEPTAVPLAIKTMTPEQISAGLPPDFAAALAKADPSKGPTLALTHQCHGCHSTDPAVTMTGPTWHNLGDTAANRIPGQSPGLYIYDSITNPGSFTVPGFPAGVMPQNIASTLKPDELADMVAYLLTLHE